MTFPDQYPFLMACEARPARAPPAHPVQTACPSGALCLPCLRGALRGAADRKPACMRACVPTLTLRPLLQESLHELNQRMPAPLPMNRFRPNIVISGGAAFAEDGWAELVIGRLDMQMRKPCGRCKARPSLQTAAWLMQFAF